ncbi:MAG: hypothetical protein R2764_02660 [Bacteroidales bacterium]
MEQVHIGKMIEEQMAPLMTRAKLARMLGLKHPTVSRMLKTRSVQTKKLLHVSERMNYNFFRVIGEMLAISEPSFAEASEGKEVQLNELTAEVERLREENRYLKKAIDLLGGGLKD